MGPHPDRHRARGPGACAYENVTESLQLVGVAILYIVANIALGIHLFHGSWSLFQSLGLNNPRFNNARRVLRHRLRRR